MSEFDRIVSRMRSERHEKWLAEMKVGDYIFGHGHSRFAITKHRGKAVWRLPWQRPRGGWWIGHLIFWWSR